MDDGYVSDTDTATLSRIIAAVPICPHCGHESLKLDPTTARYYTEIEYENAWDKRNDVNRIYEPRLEAHFGCTSPQGQNDHTYVKDGHAYLIVTFSVREDGTFRPLCYEFEIFEEGEEKLGQEGTLWPFPFPPDYPSGPKARGTRPKQGKAL